ncbi:MAG: S-adenosylmethionine:tRNA ribosyltransferase-isomerase [Candidatus Pacebacteria bacterium GW2011_GWF1_36_5]|nr:MAG: S-adenosylmethionine:tRNA ribosyltransferase-isomerase [Candidatus Pacebacteria bacterium GW2011_GWF1_36_5]
MLDLDIKDILAKYDYPLSENKIANQPIFPRDHSKLLLLNRQTGAIEDHFFYELTDLLNADDVLVLNETKVFAARLLGKKQSGGKVELLLIKQISPNSFEAISKPGLKLGQKLYFPRRTYLDDAGNLMSDLDASDFLQAEVVFRDGQSAKVRVEFNQTNASLLAEIDLCGFTPLPPYIHPIQSEETIKAEYQTVYAKEEGSAAAPTAGLHFTQELLDKLKEKGVQIEKITLHVGLGTFAKLTSENLKNKTLHSEYYEISTEVVARLNQAKKAGKRIIAVGTTSTRSLESAVLLSESKKELLATAKETNIFIDPPYQFNFIDALITNFHLPKSSLLMLVSAFISKPNSQADFNNFLDSSIGQAYQHALESDYRFFSFGDAMFIQ